MKRRAILLAAGVVLLVACTKNIQSQEAVRQGVLSHLSSRAGLDVKSMDIEVTSVVFRDQEADATVSFRAKGSTDPAGGMQMKYTLERKGNVWVVKNRADSGGSPHSGAMTTEPGSPGAAGGVPPGHPPMSETEPQGEKK